jgi:uncharacterized protein (DUF1501 family)
MFFSTLSTSYMKRRDFLRRTATMATAGVALPHIVEGLPLYASSPVDRFGSSIQNADNILIVVQLFGGNDGLNTIIPVQDPAYVRLRPNLALNQNEAVRILTSNTFMHPALADPTIPNRGFQGLMEQGRLAIVQNVGYENPNLSHFRSTDIWLSGFNSSNPDDRLTTGWLGRHFAKNFSASNPNALPDYPLCVQVGGTLSMMFRSDRGDMGIALDDPEAFFRLGRGVNPDDESPGDGSTYAQEYDYIKTIAAKSDRYSQVVKDAFDRGRNTVDTYAAGFAQQLRLVARLISGGLQSKVYMVYLGGFDTHVSQQARIMQGTFSGLHPRLLRDLSTGISQFMQDAIQQRFADRVVGLTISEFGRRPEENGSRGTDHGAASVQFVFGNNVRGGVYGQNPNLTDLNANGDVKYEFDYRRVYAEMLSTWLGATSTDLQDILQARVNPLPVLNARATSVRALVQSNAQAMQISPQPCTGTATLRFELREQAHVEITLFDLRGIGEPILSRSLMIPGHHTVPLNIANSGQYFVGLRVNGVLFTEPLVVLR